MLHCVRFRVRLAVGWMAEIEGVIKRELSGMPIYVLEPPTQYVHPYHGRVIERVLPLQEARNPCAHMGAPADACAWQGKNKCFIVIPRNGPVSDLNAYRRHEIAHCNG